MTDEESPNTDSRRARLATRRRRMRIVAAFIAILVIAGGVGTAMALRNRDETPAISAPHTGAAPSDEAPDSTAGTARKVGPPRVITHDNPMRLWIGGDSLAGSFGPALGQKAGATGVIDATIDYKVSSGLSDNGIRNWPEHAQQAMSDINPDAIVFIIGTNDASIVNSQDSNNDGVPDWQVSYGAKIETMMRAFVGDGHHRTVYWLGPPTLGDSTLEKGAYELGRFMKSEAAKFAPDVVYVDTYRLFSDANGDYSRSLPDSTGVVKEMRISDGVHFSVDGANYLSDAIWKLLDKRWDVTAHADPSQPIAYTIAPGSNDYVPGVGHYRPTVPQQSYNTTSTADIPITTVVAPAPTSTTKPVAPPTTKPVASTTKPVATTTNPPGKVKITTP